MFLEKISQKQDDRILGLWGKGGAQGTAIQLRTPTAAIASITRTPDAESNSQAFTPIFDVRAVNQNSPEVLTVVVGSPNIQFDTTGNPAGANFDLKARVEWGVGGGRQQADFDIRDGQCVTVLGTYVRVSAIYSAVGSVAAIPTVNMNGCISYGPRGTGQTPPTWTGTETVDGGATAVFFIPPFAVDVVVYSYNATTGLSTAVTIQFGTTAVVNGPGGIITQPVNIAPVYRLPHNVRELFVTNAVAPGTAVVNTVVFGLLL